MQTGLQFVPLCGGTEEWDDLTIKLPLCLIKRQPISTKSKAVPVIGLGGQLGCEMLSVPHYNM
jgi:hypothetical protein